MRQGRDVTGGRGLALARRAARLRRRAARPPRPLRADEGLPAPARRGLRDAATVPGAGPGGGGHAHGCGGCARPGVPDPRAAGLPARNVGTDGARREEEVPRRLRRRRRGVERVARPRRGGRQGPIGRRLRPRAHGGGRAEGRQKYEEAFEAEPRLPAARGPPRLRRRLRFSKRGQAGREGQRLQEAADVPRLLPPRAQDPPKLL